MSGLMTKTSQTRVSIRFISLLPGVSGRVDRGNETTGACTTCYNEAILMLLENAHGVDADAGNPWETVPKVTNGPVTLKGAKSPSVGLFRNRKCRKCWFDVGAMALQRRRNCDAGGCRCDCHRYGEYIPGIYRRKTESCYSVRRSASGRQLRRQRSGDLLC